MTNNIQTRFKRVETKYILKNDQYEALLEDLKVYLKEDDYPTSTISNIYFDTPDFDVIKDALSKRNRREKIRMRSYSHKASENCQAFLEVKQKDDFGVGHKFRLVSNPKSIKLLLSYGYSDKTIADQNLLDEIHALRDRYQDLAPRVFIYYDRYSLKQKKELADKVRVTFDKNLRYRDTDVSLSAGSYGNPLLEPDQMIMEIKASADKPEWLQEILDKHGLAPMTFSKYACAYHKSQGLDYQDRPKMSKECVGA